MKTNFILWKASILINLNWPNVTIKEETNKIKFLICYIWYFVRRVEPFSLILPHSAQRKDLSYPKGIEGWAEEWYYIHQLTSQPPGPPEWIKPSRWRPQNIKSGISEQPLTRSSSNCKLKRRGPIKIKKCLKWRQPQMGDFLKI